MLYRKPPPSIPSPQPPFKIDGQLLHSAHEHAEVGCEEGELLPEAAWEVVEEVEGDADVGNVVAPSAGRVGVFELEWHGQGV